MPVSGLVICLTEDGDADEGWEIRRSAWLAGEKKFVCWVGVLARRLKIRRLLAPDGPEIRFVSEGENRRVVLTSIGPEIVRGFDLDRQDWRTFRREKIGEIEWRG